MMSWTMLTTAIGRISWAKSSSYFESRRFSIWMSNFWLGYAIEYLPEHFEDLGKRGMGVVVLAGFPQLAVIASEIT
jgi:hypothetical protein